MLMLKSYRLLARALGRGLRYAPFVWCALTLGACAAARGPENARPRANEPAYPVVLGTSAERRELALGAWQALVQAQGLQSPSQPELQSVTATIKALPPDVVLRLPKVEIKAEAAASEDEATREALRRFFEDAGPLLGVATKDLSLVEIKTEADGTKRALYRQNPFPHPLRGGYGVIELRFTPDGRVNSFTSSALPDTERLTRALAAQAAKLTAQDAEKRLTGHAFTYPGINNTTLSYTIGPNDAVKARELVVYPVSRAGDAAALELHLAWELAVGRADEPFLVYVDAITGETVAAEATATQKAQAP